MWSIKPAEFCFFALKNVFKRSTRFCIWLLQDLSRGITEGGQEGALRYVGDKMKLGGSWIAVDLPSKVSRQARGGDSPCWCRLCRPCLASPAPCRGQRLQLFNGNIWLPVATKLVQSWNCCSTSVYSQQTPLPRATGLALIGSYCKGLLNSKGWSPFNLRGILPQDWRQ